MRAKLWLAMRRRTRKTVRRFVIPLPTAGNRNVEDKGTPLSRIADCGNPAAMQLCDHSDNCQP